MVAAGTTPGSGLTRVTPETPTEPRGESFRDGSYEVAGTGKASSQRLAHASGGVCDRWTQQARFAPKS